jgi:hypothetical protein
MIVVQFKLDQQLFPESETIIKQLIEQQFGQYDGFNRDTISITENNSIKKDKNELDKTK